MWVCEDCPVSDVCMGQPWSKVLSHISQNCSLRSYNLVSPSHPIAVKLWSLRFPHTWYIHVQHMTLITVWQGNVCYEVDRGMNNWLIMEKGLATNPSCRDITEIHHKLSKKIDILFRPGHILYSSWSTTWGRLSLNFLGIIHIISYQWYWKLHWIFEILIRVLMACEYRSHRTRADKGIHERFIKFSLYAWLLWCCIMIMINHSIT